MVTKEQIDKHVAKARTYLGRATATQEESVIVAIADENDRLRAQLAGAASPLKAPSNLAQAIASSRDVLAAGLPTINGERKAEIYGAAALVVHLADENNRLSIENAKLLLTLEHSATHRALDALAMENSALRAQLAEAVALLERYVSLDRSPTIDVDVDAFLAKLEGTP